MRAVRRPPSEHAPPPRTFVAALAALSLAVLLNCASQSSSSDRNGPTPGQGKTTMTPTTSATAAPKLTLLADLTGPYGTHLAFDRDGSHWALADSRTIQLGRDGALEQKLTAAEPIHDLTWSADDKTLDAGAQRYDLEQGAWQKLPGLRKAMVGGLDEPPPIEQVGIAAAAMAADGKDLVIATRFFPTRDLDGQDSYRGPDERLLALLADGSLRGVLYAGDREQRALAIGDRLIAAGGSKVAVWDRQTLRKLAELPHKLVARALAFNSAGDCLAVLTADGEVTLWDPHSGTKITSFAAHQGDGYTLAFHPTQPLLATGGQDGKLRLWTLGGAPVHEEQIGGWVQAVAFAPSGNRLAAATRAMPPHLMIYEVSAP